MFANIFGETDVGPVYGAAGGSVQAAYGPGPSAGGNSRHPLLQPDSGFAWGFWLGVAGLVVLVMVRRSLPA